MFHESHLVNKINSLKKQQNTQQIVIYVKKYYITFILFEVNKLQKIENLIENWRKLHGDFRKINTAKKLTM